MALSIRLAEIVVLSRRQNKTFVQQWMPTLRIALHLHFITKLLWMIHAMFVYMMLRAQNSGRGKHGLSAVVVLLVCSNTMWVLCNEIERKVLSDALYCLPWNKATACDNGLCLQLKHRFLGAFAKLRKAIFSFASLSACNNWAPNRNTLIKFDIWVIFLLSVENIQVSLKTDQRVLCVKTNIQFLSYLDHSFLKREMFQIKVVEEIETFSVQYFFLLCLNVTL
jgi:hypothetical protein